MRCFADISDEVDKHLATVISIESLGQRTKSSCLEVVLVDTKLPVETCTRVDNGAQWAYE